MKKNSLIKSICATVGVLTPAVALSTIGCSNYVPTPEGNIPIEDLLIEDKALIGIKEDADVSKYDTLLIPKDVVEVSRFAFSGSSGYNLPSNITNIVFEEGEEPTEGEANILYISGYAFHNCKHIKRVKFSSRTEFVDENVFNGCESLNELDFSTWSPEKIAGNSPFSSTNIFTDCPASGKLVLPEGCDFDAYFMLSGTGLGSAWLTYHPGQMFVDEENNCEYYLDPNGEKVFARIHNINALGDTYTIPSIYTRIEPKALFNVFKRWSYFGPLRHIKFGDASRMKKIGHNAFSNNDYIRDIDLSNCSQLECIDVAAFYSIPELQTVIFPDQTGDPEEPHMKSLGSFAFANNTSLTAADITITLLEKIGVAAFSGCTKLETLDLPSTTRMISALAISGNTKLTGITIPSNITYIGARAFMGCTSVEVVNFGEATSLEYIGEQAFYDCDKCKAIEIPQSVRYIGDGAFSNMDLLEAITVQSEDYFKVLDKKILYTAGDANNRLIAALKGTTTDEIPKDELRTIGTIGKYAFENLVFQGTNEITLKRMEQLHKIGFRAFYNVKMFNEEPIRLTLSEYVEKIEDYAFANSSVREISFDYLKAENIKFGIGLFSRCDNITQVDIPRGVTNIPNYCFEYCHNLNSLTIPSSVQKIGAQAFWMCDGLLELHLESFDEIPNWDQGSAFKFFLLNDLNCYVKSQELIEKWEDFFQNKLKVDISKWYFAMPT